MRSLPPRRLGRVVGFGADANGLNPGDSGYDSTTDPNSADYIPPVSSSDVGPAPGQGDVPINGSSVPEGSPTQNSTASGTLNSLQSGWNTLSNWFTGGNTSNTSTTTNNSSSNASPTPSSGTPNLTVPGSTSTTSSFASMSVLGVPLWLIVVAVGGVVAVNVFGKKGMGRHGGKRRGKKQSARRAHGRRRNPVKRGYVSRHKKRRTAAQRNAEISLLKAELKLLRRAKSKPVYYREQIRQIKARLLQLGVKAR